MQPIPVKADDLIEALDWIQAGIQSDHAAYVERATGEVICFSPELDGAELAGDDQLLTETSDVDAGIGFSPLTIERPEHFARQRGGEG